MYMQQGPSVSAPAQAPQCATPPPGPSAIQANKPSAGH